MTDRPPFRWDACTAVLGTAVLVAGVFAASVAPPADLGEVPAASSAGVAAATSPGSDDDGKPATPRADPVTPVIEIPGLGERAVSSQVAMPVPDPPAVVPPTGIRLPGLGVDAEVRSVGIADDRSMEIPDDVAEVGWFGLGPSPGRPGSAVLAGHVDGGGQRGAFWDLRRLEPGDRFEFDHVDGSATTWEVVARRTHRKEDLPVEELFDRDGPPRLVLITCGGAFDPSARSYVDNVVVHAVPAG